MSATEALAVVDARHRFGRAPALDGATCIVARGSVHALLGENGAGKTTLMRIAYGALTPDHAQLRLDGVSVTLRSSREAIQRGVGMVHQHFSLVPAMTVAENVALGGRGALRPRETRDAIRAVGAETGLVLDPDARVATLPVGAQQRVEIVKALARQARTLILDEPTAVLSPAEGAELMDWLRRFADRGGAVVLITHKLREAMAVADAVTVLRRGRTVLQSRVAALSEPDLVAALTGGAAPTVRAAAPDASRPDAPVLLGLRHVSVTDATGVTRLRDVSLDVRAGDVVGVLGVEGSGPHELLRVLAGRLPPTAGDVALPPRVGFVPEDRLGEAVIPVLSLVENHALADAGARHGTMDWAAEAESARAAVTAMDVRVDSVHAPVASLSGGNQQRFVLGRERDQPVLVAEQPTRGLDLVATAQVLAELAAVAGSPTRAVVMHSADLDEVLAVATRVLVCYAGTVREIAWPADRQDRTPFTRAMTGAL